MNREKNIKKGFKAGVLVTTMFSFIIAFLMLSNTVTDSYIERQVFSKKNMPVPLGDASLVDGATKVLCMMHYPHQNDPGTAYASNLSNASAYEFYDYLSNEMTGETPFNTAFDVVFKVAINTNHGYNSTSSAWENTLFNATLNGITGYNFTGDVDLVEQEIGTSDTWAFYHFYLQDADGGGGNGFQIGQGVSTNATFELWAFQ